MSLLPLICSIRLSWVSKCCEDVVFPRLNHIRTECMWVYRSLHASTPGRAICLGSPVLLSSVIAWMQYVGASGLRYSRKKRQKSHPSASGQRSLCVMRLFFSTVTYHGRPLSSSQRRVSESFRRERRLSSVQLERSVTAAAAPRSSTGSYLAMCSRQKCGASGRLEASCSVILSRSICSPKGRKWPRGPLQSARPSEQASSPSMRTQECTPHSRGDSSGTVGGKSKNSA
mmetsp:Transcript_5673/g.15061  ORF Transcript_5673/g.15061 Transcript_5673/m.15061 type:complete len:229 (-) Transcript_5673:395-1081(-)